MKLTVDDQDFPGSLLLGQSIEDRVDGFTEDGTVGSDILRGTKVLVVEGAGFDGGQDIPSDVGLPTTLLEIFQSRLDGNDIVSVTGTLDIRESLSVSVIVSDIDPYVTEILTGPIMRLATIAAGPS